MSTPADLRIEAVTTLPEMRLLLPEWQELWDRCFHATTFQRPQWILSWIESFRPSNPILLQVRKHGELVGLLPLIIYQRGSERVLALMGGGVSDYLDALVDPRHENEVVGRFWDFVSMQSSSWDTVEFTDLPSTSALLGAGARDSYVETHPHDVCPILRLPPQTENLKTVVPPNKMANLRNVRNRTARAGQPRVEIASVENVVPMMESLFQLHTIRWQKLGRPGVLGEVAIQRFHLQVAGLLLGLGALRLYSFFLDDQLLSAMYTFFEEAIVYIYIQAFDPEHAHLSPGAQLFARVIEDAIRLGKSSVDFLRGREPYKYLWGTHDTSTYRIELRNVDEKSALSPTGTSNGAYSLEGIPEG